MIDRNGGGYPECSTLKRARKSYIREEKLKVVKYYHDNSNNLYKTCKRFSMNSKSDVMSLNYTLHNVL